MLLASHSQSRLIQAIIAIDFLSRRQHNNNEILDNFSAVYLLETYCHESLNSHHSSKRQVSGHRLSMDWPMASSTKDKSAHKPQLQATGAGASSWQSLPLQPQQATGARPLHQLRIFPLLQQMIPRTDWIWAKLQWPNLFICLLYFHYYYELLPACHVMGETSDWLKWLARSNPEIQFRASAGCHSRSFKARLNPVHAAEAARAWSGLAPAASPTKPSACRWGCKGLVGLWLQLQNRRKPGPQLHGRWSFWRAQWHWIESLVTVAIPAATQLFQLQHSYSSCNTAAQGKTWPSKPQWVN